MTIRLSPWVRLAQERQLPLKDLTEASTSEIVGRLRHLRGETEDGCTSACCRGSALDTVDNL